MVELKASIAKEVGGLYREHKCGELLSKLSNVVSNIPPSTASVERAFSIARMYVNRLTTRLSDSNVQLTSFGAHDFKNLNEGAIPDVETSMFAEMYPDEVRDVCEVPEE